MAVIKDVADYADVSVGSVSRYLKNPMLLKEKTRKKIESAINELQYSPSLSARGMRNQNLKRIALVINDVNNPFFAHMFTRMHYFAQLRGMETILFNPSPEKKKFELELSEMPNRSFNNMIFCYLPEWAPAVSYAKINSTTISSLFIGGRQITDEASSIIIDYSTGMNDLIDKAYEMGHKKVCYVGNFLNLVSQNTKFVAVRDKVESLAETDCDVEFETIDLERVPFGFFEGKWDWERGIYAADTFIDKGFKSTLIIVKNDLVALGAMKRFAERGVKVPEDISIVGCDNIMNAQMSTPTLATIEFSLDEICENAISMLEEMSCYYPARPITKTFKTYYVPGGSLGPAKK